MERINVVWQQYRADLPSGINGEYWDQTMLHDLFKGKMWHWERQYEFVYRNNVSEVEGDGCVIVMPARQQTEYVEKLNQDIARFKWVILMLTGDEESVFPTELLNHPNMRLWVMSPRPERHSKDKYGHEIRRLGSGYTPGQREYLQSQALPNKELDWFFAGQLNHKRRHLCAAALDSVPNGILKGSTGFGQGLPQEEYWKYLADAKLAPCPAGGHTPDTFRLFEALESGCFPIADEVTEVMKYDLGYWEWFFGEAIPFYPLTDYNGMKDYMKNILKDWKHLSNKTFAWWIKMKRQMAYNLRQDIRDVSGIDFDDTITVLIPTSTIKLHPSTEIIDQTIQDIRAKLPEAEIIIMVDGLNAHFSDRKADYEEYTRRLIWKCNVEWKNVLPLVFDKPTHQVGMAREALKIVKTPTILYVEHDAPICSDVEFGYSWDELVKTILEGTANVVRFHHEARILPEHEELMIGPVEYVNGVPMRKTMQWSQRPHLARTEFYKQMLYQYFAPDAFGMIEDHIYSKCLIDCREHGMMGWYNWRIWVFHPEGDNIKRSYTVDGRQDDLKYDEEYHY